MSEYDVVDAARVRDHELLTSPERTIAQNLGELAYVLREATMGWAINIDNKSGIEFIVEAAEHNTELIAQAIEHGLTEIANAITAGMRYHASVMAGPGAEYHE